MITTDTTISYPDGAIRSTGRIVHLEPLENGRIGVALDTTAAHPVDPTWPDQGPDLGTLSAGGRSSALLDCRIGAWDGAALHLGDRLPVRLGTPDWSFVVVHAIDEVAGFALGEEVVVEVDAPHRASLSAGHTACHLASLALNAVLEQYWSKPVRTDSLGHPDFDSLTIQESRIHAFGSVDTYRLGKSLRKSGFDTAAATADLGGIGRQVDTLVATWIGADSGVHISRDDQKLSVRRTWHCVLPAGEASIPCGGTHVEHLAQLGDVRVQLDLDESASALTMRTTVMPVGE